MAEDSCLIFWSTRILLEWSLLSLWVPPLVGKQIWIGSSSGCLNQVGATISIFNRSIILQWTSTVWLDEIWWNCRDIIRRCKTSMWLNCFDQRLLCWGVCLPTICCECDPRVSKWMLEFANYHGGELWINLGRWCFSSERILMNFQPFMWTSNKGQRIVSVMMLWLSFSGVFVFGFLHLENDLKFHKNMGMFHIVFIFIV